MKNSILFTVLFSLLVTGNIFAQNITYSNPWHSVNSPHGSIKIGPANSSGAHIYSDLPKFFFNKPIWAITGEFSAYSNKNLKLQTSGTTRMTILKSNGNVGVGRTNPLQKLDVKGNIKLGNGADAYLQNTTGYIGVRPADDTHGFIIRDYTGQGYSWSGMRHVDAPNVDRLEFAVLNADSYGKSLVITQNERVGIGTKYPQHKLDVDGSARIKQVSIGGNSDGSGFHDGITGKWSLQLNAAKSGGTGGDIVMRSEGVAKMKIKSNGEISSTPSPGANNMRYVGGNYGIIHRNDGDSYYMLLTNNGNAQGSWNDFRPFQLNNASGNIYMGNHTLNVIHGQGVGIGTSNLSGDYKLAVNGKIRSKEVVVESNWADYVFYDDYDLPTLEEEEKHIEENGYLLGFESAEDMQGEIRVADVSSRQQVKIEEMMLHLIEMKKQMAELNNKVAELEEENQQLKKQPKTHK